MTTLNFPEAIAELVRQFPVLDPDDQELAMHQVRGLTVVADKKNRRGIPCATRPNGSTIFRFEQHRQATIGVDLLPI